MKLKNFIKRQKPLPVKDTKTFHTSVKPGKKTTRASEKNSHKSKKRIVNLTLIAIGIFIVVAFLSMAAFLYRNYILEKLNPDTIISPGTQNVIELDSAREILVQNGVDFSNFGYASGSSQLTLTINGTTVYFSNSLEFEKQVKILADIMYSLKSEDKNARIIDLRYNRPIVKF